MKKLMVMAMLVLWASGGVALAAEHGTTSGAAGQAVDSSPHPTVPDHPTWVRPLVILILGLFAVAIPVGMFVRATMPEEMPPTHAHDEHHGHRDPDDHGAAGHDAHGHGHGAAGHGH